MEFRRGLRSAPLTKRIKSILEQYADDGQILKELIQNADDAGATTVKFLLDEGQYETSPEGLIHPDMAQFQGPALLVYNDAVFSEDDWDGICRIEESIKEKDIIQTGRFGLGFKSIFHITDLPIIASGDYIGIMDPHQKYLPERESAWNWHLSDEKDFLQSKEEQFRPMFKGIFDLDVNTLSKIDRYNHTAFRFPLRTKANVLSDNIYTAAKVLQLFHSLEVDKGHSLLFLKSVQCIEIYRQSQAVDEPELLYRMTVAENSAKQVSKIRQAFLEKVRQGEWRNKAIETILQLTVQTEHFQTDESIEAHDWLVYHTCHGDKAVIDAADELKFLPWVGIALPISESTDPKLQFCQSAGHLFATLPLPLDGTETTGLAFHVHAYFAMEQNRRHLRWPTSDQNQESSDTKIKWNQLLVRQCIPAAVVAFFRQAVCCGDDKIGITPDSLYGLLPNEDAVDLKWGPVVSQIYKELFTETCLYSPAKDKGWLKVEDTIRADDHLPDRVNKLLEQVLLAAGFPVISVPPHIQTAIKKYSLKQQNTISALDVHKATLQLTKNGNVLERDDALMLLQYFLDNGQPQDLIGLPLLPVLSGEMACFQEEQGSTPISLSSKEHPAALLPGLEERLVVTNLPDQLLASLTTLSQTGATQLKQLSFKDTIKNLPHILPSTRGEGDVVHWSSEDTAYPSLTWLEQIWDYIHLNSPSVQEWQILDNLHLMPLGNCQMCKFSVGKQIILGQTEQNTLPTGVVDFLSEVGCIVLKECPDFVYRHKDLLYHSVNLPTCQGITDAMMSVSLRSREMFIDKIRQFWCCRKSSLSDFVSYMSDSGIRLLSSKNKRFLLGLPLFSTVSGSGFQLSKNVSLNEIHFSNPSVELPVPFPVPVIDVSDEKVKYMIESLDVCKYHQDSFPQLLQEMLLPAVKSGRYTNEQAANLLCHIMDHHPKVILNNMAIAAAIAEVALVESNMQEMKSPKELYHPQAPFLPSLLGREFFPHKKYHSSDRLACLDKLGLRPVKQLTPEIFLQIAKSLSSKPGRANDFIQLTKTLADQVPHGNWWEKLRDVAFLRVVQVKPDGYPNHLPWKGSAVEVLAPQDVCHIRFAKQAGSAVPFVDLDESILAVLQAKTTPSRSDMVIQLKHVTEHYNTKEKSCYLAVLDKVYCGLAQFTKNEILDSLDHHSVSSWIWYGNGFKCAGQMLLEDPEMKLSPYYYSLPSEMEMHKDLLHRCGVPRTVHLEKVLEDIATKHMEEEGQNKSIVSHDLQLATNLLMVLCKQGAKTALVPIETPDASTLHFKSALECTVWDESCELDDDDDLFFVHPSVPNEVISHFCIPTVMQRELEGEEIGIVQDFGQNEPLTTRLQSVLKGYTDGLAVLKEMIQNADDAGATEVQLVYDMRENRQWRKSLLDPAMADWQGPSMWIYNNAVFTDEDFENIRKLNGATKKEREDQIGTFGLGFNAVYNLTDVPSVLSHDTLVIFDPHTTNLGRALRDKTKPGKKIPLTRKLLRKYSDQFAPWNGVCGCGLKADSKKANFNGTLFRLPLRGHKQSIFSQISNNCYDEQNVKELLKMVHGNGSSILLFTQNVLKVSVSVIPEEGNGPDLQKKDLFEIHKEPVQYLHEHGIQCNMSCPSQEEDLPTQKFINECSLLKASVTSNNTDGMTRGFKSSMIIKTVVETSEEGSKLLGETVSKSGPQSHTHWIVSQIIEDMPFVQGLTAKQQPVAGIAICLKEENDRYKIKPLDDSCGSPKGSYFSFLPLPVKSPLPFHINGTFVLDQSRRHLVQKTDHDKDLAGGAWNKGLLEGAVCTAYMTALSDIISLSSQDEELSAILPVIIEDDLITSMSEMFWQRILQQPKTLDIFLGPRGRVTMHDAYFLDPDFQQSCLDMEENITEVITSVFEGSHKTLIKLPKNLEHTLGQVHSGVLDSKIITEEVFFTKFFLPNMSSLPLAQRDRDVLLVKALKSRSSQVENALKSTACIPVSPDGEHLAQPSTLIHPVGKAAVLYIQEESKFPAVTCDGDSERKMFYEKLCTLGMVRDDVSWDGILERSRHLAKIGPKSNIQQVQHFLEYLQWKLATEKDQIPSHVQKALQTERFLPSDIKPKEWKLTWKGEEYSSYCGSELYNIKEPLIACTQLPILHRDISISLDVSKYLGIKGDCTGQSVSIGTVKLHVQEILSNEENIKYPCVRDSLRRIYKYLNTECEDDIKAEKVRQEFSTQCFLLVEDNLDRRLVSAAVCAFDPKWTAFPYLNRVSKTYERLYRQVGVVDHFGCNNFMASMVMIQEGNREKILDTTTLHTVKRTLEELCKQMPEGCESITDLGIENAIYIPDSMGVLKPAEGLCYNKLPGVGRGLPHPLVNACITNNVASSLGVKELGAQVLSERTHGIAYCKDTHLVEEIHSVLEAYPHRSQILIELLQQADHAGATEIHFKLDPGKHNSKRVFSEEWKAMQGPSLCVENDAKLNRDVLAGLFLPGNENTNHRRYKGDIGIQSVFHLTDTPTVLATLDDDNETELLCAYDPTCNHVKGTSPQEPAMMYKDVPLLRKFFPGVFECYQKKGFGYPKGTQFRFPLRNPEAANDSPICHSPGHYEDVDAMLKNLIEDGYRALIFMTSLRKINITRFDTTQNKFATVVVTSTILEDESKIKDFKQHIEMDNRQQTENGIEYKFQKVSYALRLNKTNGEEEMWTVVQHYGIEKSCHNNEFSKHEYQELQKRPIGGVAERENEDRSLGNLLLPSNQRIDLPVQVLGTLQGVYFNDDKTYSKAALDNDWNTYITEIIARAYLDLIKARTDLVTAKVKEADFGQSAIVREYFNIFPTDQDRMSPVSEPIVKRLYEMMTEEKMLPEQLPYRTGTKWVTTSEACFLPEDNLKYMYMIQGANLCGLKIVNCPDAVQKMIKRFCHNKPLDLSAGVLLNFLGDQTKCHYAGLSKLVESDKDNPWNPGMKVVKEVIKFCKTEKSFSEQLDRIPLLVTSDGVLRTFDVKRPVYKSLEMRWLTPHSAKFLHPKFLKVFKDVNSPVFKDLDIEGFCEELTLNYPQLAKNQVIDFDNSRIQEAAIEDIWIAMDKIGTNDIGQIKEHAGHLSIWLTSGRSRYLYPIDKMYRVFQRRTFGRRRNSRVDHMYDEIRSDGDIPVSVHSSSVADSLLASFDRPNTVLHALHHYQQQQIHVSDIWRNECWLEYFTENRRHLMDDEQLKDLPIFETLAEEHVRLTGNYVNVIPSEVPMVDMDAWATPRQGMLFLTEKPAFKDLYELLGCIVWSAEEVYTKYIFTHFELLSEQGQRTHMDWVFENLGDSPKVVEAMRDLYCVRNIAGTFCKPSDLYDPEIDLFLHMQGEDLPAADLSNEVLRKAGMICEATKEMLAAYAMKPPQIPNTCILDYVKENVQPEQQAQYLEFLSDIPFIPRRESGNSSICPESSDKPYVALRGSVVVSRGVVCHSGLAWAVAPLIDDLQTDFDEDVLASAGVIIEPPCELVASNIVKVCEHGISEQTLSTEDRRKLSGLIDTCYNYISAQFENGECTDQDKKRLQAIMGDQFCVPVDQATRFVKAHETVIELKPNEEIKPYLNRLPDNLKYSKEVLKWLGLAEKPTIRAYQRVLSMIHDKFDSCVITNAEDIQAAKQATRQVFKRIKKDRSLDQHSLWLLSKTNRLYKSQSIIYSNNLGIERRLTQNVNLLVNINLKVNIEHVLEYFPGTHRPQLLTSVVKEEVQHEGDTTKRFSGKLRQHLVSDAMQQGCQRLIHHIMITNAKEDIDETIDEKIAEVQGVIENIQVLSVENLKTRLKLDTRVIGDWKERMFFAERDMSVFYLEKSSIERSSDHFYMYKVLADMVNDLNKGFFSEHMNVLMILLSTEAERIGERLDDMGILPYPP